MAPPDSRGPRRTARRSRAGAPRPHSGPAPHPPYWSAPVACPARLRLCPPRAPRAASLAARGSLPVSSGSSVATGPADSAAWGRTEGGAAGSADATIAMGPCPSQASPESSDGTREGDISAAQSGAGPRRRRELDEPGGGAGDAASAGSPLSARALGLTTGAGAGGAWTVVAGGATAACGTVAGAQAARPRSRPNAHPIRTHGWTRRGSIVRAETTAHGPRFPPPPFRRSFRTIPVSFSRTERGSPLRVGVPCAPCEPPCVWSRCVSPSDAPRRPCPSCPRLPCSRRIPRAPRPSCP
jgi:hypothetical protein